MANAIVPSGTSRVVHCSRVLRGAAGKNIGSRRWPMPIAMVTAKPSVARCACALTKRVRGTRSQPWPQATARPAASRTQTKASAT